MARKWRDRIENILKKEREKLSAEYNEAFLNWSDTGYERYRKKCERIEDQITEIDVFRDAKIDLAKAENQIRLTKQAIEEYREKLNDEKKADPYSQAIKRLSSNFMVLFER